MYSPAKSVKEYLASLPTDRRASIEAVRNLIVGKLPKGYEEAIQWGVISWQVPLSVYPDTYNGKPLSYAALASQKNYLALYLCGVYGSALLRERLVDGFKAAGKKLDMGKSCIRFKAADDLPLGVIGKVIAAIPMKTFVAFAKKVHSGKRRRS